MNDKPLRTNADKLNCDEAANDDASKPAKTAKNEGRRIQDEIASKDPKRKLNLDRRVTNSERRLSDDSNYKGPSRRYTIDRRVNLKDRRDKD